MRILLLVIGLLLQVGFVAAHAEPFRLAVISERPSDPVVSDERHARLIQTLQTRLAARGVGPVELVVARDIDDLRRRFKSGQVDAVMESLFSLFSLEQGGISLKWSLAASRRGARESYSVFFVPKDSPVKSLSDLKGRVLALESPRSTTAFALPLAELRRHGMHSVAIDDGKNGRAAVRYVLVGDEANQAYWVTAGRADAGAFNIDDWQALPELVRDRLRIIHSTESVLRWLLVFRGDMPAATRNEVEAVLLAMHGDADGRDALKAARGIRQFDALESQDVSRIAAWRRVIAN